MVLSVIVTLLLAAGVLFLIGGALGILRLPDFYTRLHAAGMLDTMGLLFLLGGSVVYVIAHDATLNGIITVLKIILIAVFVFITSPTATHAIVDAGLRAGMKPWTKADRKEKTP